MPKRTEVKSGAKSEETRLRILNAALELFRQRGFEAATMRDIAGEAGVATGAAYYYFPSKEAIVMAFYEQTSAEMQPKIEAALEKAKGLEERLRELIRVKWTQFAPHRSVLRALLRNGADPAYALSPFSPQTRAIRETDMEWFRRILVDCGMRIPKDLEEELPGVLWFVQMGAIYFWVIDETPGQASSERLLGIAAKSVAMLVRISALPLLRPARKAALEVVQIVKGAVAA